MHTEYEVRILNIDKEEVVEKLNKLNATFEWDELQRRYVYDFIPKVDNKWIRLRTNGKKTTLTIKNLVSSEIDGTQELEIEVDSFERTNLILKELGYEAKGYQENRRRQYLLNGVEIDIDSWPLLPDYLEIEGPSEEAVFNALEVLGFSQEDIQRKFGFFIDAFKYGTPPHGGMAFGLDRLTMILAGTDNIRDVIAFPKNLSAVCPMSQAPGVVDEQQLKDLGIAITEFEK